MRAQARLGLFCFGLAIFIWGCSRNDGEGSKEIKQAIEELKKEVVALRSELKEGAHWPDETVVVGERFLLRTNSGKPITDAYVSRLESLDTERDQDRPSSYVILIARSIGDTTVTLVDDAGGSTKFKVRVLKSRDGEH